MYSQCSNVFERCITLPGCSKVSLAATSPYRLQLCVVLGGWDSNLPGHYCTLFSSSASNLSRHCYMPAQKFGFYCGETFENTALVWLMKWTSGCWHLCMAMSYRHFYFCRFLKHSVYKNNPHTWEKLNKILKHTLQEAQHINIPKNVTNFHSHTCCNCLRFLYKWNLPVMVGMMNWSS